MPNSLQAQITRRAISPRFAIRILLNMKSVVRAFAWESTVGCALKGRGFSHAVAQPLICHPERASAREGSAVSFLCNKLFFPASSSASLASLNPEQRHPVLDGAGIGDKHFGDRSEEHT